MCSPSPYLQLCSCKKGDPKPENSWELYRYAGEKGVYVVGLAEPPFPLWDHEKAINEYYVADKLNERNCFDLELKFKDRDILILHLMIDEKEHQYSFTYEVGEWTPGAESFVFELMNNYTKKKKGAVNIDIDAFKKLDYE
jgi:hypothetical protein